MSDHIEKLSRDYANAFSNKDITTLTEMFDNDIHLVDWQIYIQGIDAILEYHKMLFNSVETIQIEVLSVTSSPTTAFAEINVIIDRLPIKVLDVITFNDVDKIIKVEAYKFEEVPEDVLWQRKLAELRNRDPFIYK